MCLLLRCRWLQDMSITRGVRIEDMGHKMGCNGVDNGKLWFDGAPAAAAIAPSHCSSLLQSKLCPARSFLLEVMTGRCGAEALGLVLQ